MYECNIYMVIPDHISIRVRVRCNAMPSIYLTSDGTVNDDDVDRTGNLDPNRKKRPKKVRKCSPEPENNDPNRFGSLDCHQRIHRHNEPNRKRHFRNKPMAGGFIFTGRGLHFQSQRAILRLQERDPLALPLPLLRWHRIDRTAMVLAAAKV